MHDKVSDQMGRLAFSLLLVLSGPADLVKGQSEASTPVGQVEITSIHQVDSPPIAFGASDLMRSLEASGNNVAVSPVKEEKATQVQVVIGLVADKSIPDKIRAKVTDKAESYAINAQHDGQGVMHIYVVGHDEAGAMYGAMDLAEQIGWMRGKLDWASIEERTASPALALRGNNLFFHTQALDDPGSWYHDEEFWRNYLDMLARTRHNFLDIHTTYDAKTNLFPNIFPYFFKFKEYPNVGLNEIQAGRNLECFKKIVRMAKERGIKVGLMNYCSSWAIPPDKEPYAKSTWTHNTEGALFEWDMEGWSYSREPDEKQLADYTARCVRGIIEEVPDLAFIGFRVAESNKPAEFYECYLRGLREAGRTDVNLYTRSWGATRQQVETIATGYPGKTYVEIKYNGEHLAMPYQVTGGWMQQMSCYSYENFSDLPHDRFSIIWQIRASGEHRYYPWGDPDFVSRTLSACTFADAAGYTVEPPNAYLPMVDFHTNTNNFNVNYFRWLPERDWFWYELWGRLGYDPKTSERVWIEKFKTRFGEQAGEKVYRMFVAQSRLLPQALCLRQFHPDHSWLLPEVEFGDKIQNISHNEMPQNNGDPRADSRYSCEINSYLGLDEYCELLCSGGLSARIRPPEAWRELERLGAESRSLEELARAAAPQSRQEFEYWARNTEIMGALADYYIHKYQAAFALNMARRTRALYYLAPLKREFQTYMKAWDRLVELTRESFRPLPVRLRFRGNAYTYADEYPRLEKDRLYIEKFVNNMKEQIASASRPALAPVPLEEIAPEAPAVFRCNIIGKIEGDTKLYYRSRGQAEFNSVIMKPNGEPGLLAASLTPDQLPGKSGILEYYLRNDSATTPTLPACAPQHVYRVKYGELHTPPAIEILPIKIDRQRGKALLSARVSDPAGLLWVQAHYKRMPSDCPWVAVSMSTPPTQGGVYQVEVPMTFEGLQYCIEAMDDAGNGQVKPDVGRETPYINVDGWVKDKSTNPGEQSISEHGGSQSH